ncbi:hypothetical protein FK220_011520 [Flavobacteriaceae bacterium TP-CH-4]|uniref:Uncharacterized protein n=1 Tax=Pelagihabitans pacificus TaxID=2696054 RepID=A0A967E784_9FLAO|nr:hypothetical protein [Pelagihabitans pacificus]NHF59974.1 hypothetical protein [Pelagihabitans pacificus]
MKTLKFKFVRNGLAAIGMVLLFVTSCQKERTEEPISTDNSLETALENDQDALEMMRLAEENADEILAALKKQNISIDAFRSMYEANDEAQIAQALNLDVNAMLERNHRIRTLAQTINNRYPDLESRVDDGQVYEDPFVTMGYALDGTGKGKCSGWRNWRNIAKYTVCVAACATSTAGTAYALCSLVCYFSFCT